MHYFVAKAVGLNGAVCPPGPIPASVHPEQFVVFAGVLLEDKYKLVKAFQTGGHTVGMRGDGANDAPALRQAQIGIAVSTATDVAKSAAGMVLTAPGLAGIVAAVKEGRVTFQRILTYTLNSITKKTVQVLFLGVGLVMTGHAILTPLLMVIIMITGDFLGMSLTTDNVRPSPIPNTWQIGRLTIAGVTMGIGELEGFNRQTPPPHRWPPWSANYSMHPTRGLFCPQTDTRGPMGRFPLGAHSRRTTGIPKQFCLLPLIYRCGRHRRSWARTTGSQGGRAFRPIWPW
jgi:hypothetical protein